MHCLSYSTAYRLYDSDLLKRRALRVLIVLCKARVACMWLQH